MTSKEALEQLRKYNGIGLCGDYTLFEPIEKDLDKLEELKELMGTPIQDIMKRLKILEILELKLIQSLKIEKIDLTKEENKIYKGYLPKDYNKKYIYKWDYNYSVWDVFRNEENAILLKRWLNGKD